MIKSIALQLITAIVIGNVTYSQQLFNSSPHSLPEKLPDCEIHIMLYGHNINIRGSEDYHVYARINPRENPRRVTLSHGLDMNTRQYKEDAHVYISESIAEELYKQVRRILTHSFIPFEKKDVDVAGSNGAMAIYLEHGAFKLRFDFPMKSEYKYPKEANRLIQLLNEALRSGEPVKEG